MGCDEHMYFEVNRAGTWAVVAPDPALDGDGSDGGDGWFQTYPDINEALQKRWHLDRYYHAYAQLCGVRLSGAMPYEPWFPDRGCPPGDPSIRSFHDPEGVPDGADHSPSWFTLAELAEKMAPVADPVPRLADLLAKMIEVAKREGVSPENLRAIIGFDN